MTNKRLGGWVRLWIVISALWVIFWSIYELYPALFDPVSGKGVLPYNYEDSISSLAKGRLCEVRTDKDCWQMRMPSEAIVQLKSWVSPVEAREVGEEINELSLSYEKDLKRIRVFDAVKVVGIPPLVLLLLGLSIAWVRRGFVPGNSS